MFSSKIKEFQSDGGGEYLNKYFQQIFTNMAFIIIKRTLLAHAFTLTYWAEAMHTTVYLINWLPSKILNYQNSYHILFNKDPQYNIL